MKCSSQNKIDEKKKDANSFLIWLLNQQNDKNVFAKPIELSLETLSSMSEEVKFSKKDSTDIELQIINNNKAWFDSTLSTTKTFVDKTRVEDAYLKMSKPIYFDNGKKLWIYLEHYCGIECGNGEIQVYEKNRNDYKLLFKIRTWIS